MIQIYLEKYRPLILKSIKSKGIRIMPDSSFFNSAYDKIYFKTWKISVNCKGCYRHDCNGFDEIPKLSENKNYWINSSWCLLCANHWEMNYATMKNSSRNTSEYFFNKVEFIENRDLFNILLTENLKK